MSAEPPKVSQQPPEPPRVVGPKPSQPLAQANKSGNWKDLVHNKWAVLATLFFVTAALGLPLLWKSRGFSRNEKILWTVVVLIYTGLVFWAFGAVMWWSYARISESLAMSDKPVAA